MDSRAGAALKWVWWFNCDRPLAPLGYVPRVEYEESLYNEQSSPELVILN